MFANHTAQSLVVGFMMLCTLGCQNWGTNHDLQRKGFLVLMNAWQNCMQILPWTRSLTNFLNVIGHALQILFQDLTD
jgi:hypothetical protein